MGGVLGVGCGLEVTADDQRPVRWEGVCGWGLEATADDQRPVRWEGGGWGLELEATADDQRPVWCEEGWGGGWRRQLMTRGRGVSCGGKSGSGNWSQRGGRVKVKGLRSSRVLPVKTGVELVQSVWKRWVAADSCRFCLVLRDGL